VGNNAWRAVSDFAMYGMIAFGLYFLFVLLRWPLEKRAHARREQAEAAARRQQAEDDQLGTQAPLAAERSDRYRDDLPPAATRGAGRVEPRL
ncbi:MAG TPA: MFS transporter, partial [Pseudomonas sp.]|nr:MFS transporter [Pseudomonas sp.]